MPYGETDSSFSDAVVKPSRTVRFNCVRRLSKVRNICGFQEDAVGNINIDATSPLRDAGTKHGDNQSKVQASELACRTCRQAHPKMKKRKALKPQLSDGKTR